jgi:hypothetical protein
MVRACRAAIPYMEQQGSGSIVSVASEVARQPDPFLVDYSVSKAAVVCLAKAVSTEYGPAGICSNCVTPGPTRTSIWDRPGGFADYLADQYGLEKEAAIEHFAKGGAQASPWADRPARGRGRFHRFPFLGQGASSHGSRLQGRLRRQQVRLARIFPGRGRVRHLTHAKGRLVARPQSPTPAVGNRHAVKPQFMLPQSPGGGHHQPSLTAALPVAIPFVFVNNLMRSDNCRSGSPDPRTGTRDRRRPSPS